VDDRTQLIQTENLHRRFLVGDQTVHALNGIGLTVERGEFLAVMGPSGSGKSTLLYLLGGLDRPSEGCIWVSGRELTALDENELAAHRGRQIGFVFQSFHLIPTMTALQNVEFPMVLLGRHAEERRIRAMSLLKQMGLSARVEHKPAELSGGQQQRVAIARALANNPALILADEPTGNLDTRTGKEIVDLLFRLNKQDGRTIIIVSHDPSVSERATRTVFLRDGQIAGDRRRTQGGAFGLCLANRCQEIGEKK
jgi:putative ABC transport system ATP-binding protein